MGWLADVAPAGLVARKTTGLPLDTWMDLACAPQSCLASVTHGPEPTLASTLATPWFADTAVSTHQSLPTAFGVKVALKAVALVDGAAPRYACGADWAAWPSGAVARKTTCEPFATCVESVQSP